VNVSSKTIDRKVYPLATRATIPILPSAMLTSVTAAAMDA
jgi:hypothetical protein